MDRSQQAYRLYLFTVHLWQESIGAGQVEWRGRITNTSTGAVAYFRRWRDVEALLPTLMDEGIDIERDDLEHNNDRRGSVIEIDILTSAAPDEARPAGDGLDGDSVDSDSADDPANDDPPAKD